MSVKKEEHIAESFTRAGQCPDKLLVQKSRPLLALWRSDFTLQEFKILDTYLARIDSHHPDKRVVVFQKGELENILDVIKIDRKKLKERLTHLMGNVVEIGNPKEPKTMQMITLFNEAVAKQDDETGLWEVHMECSEKAMQYIFNIEKLGYLRYKLRGIVNLQSRYSYILFLYLESQRRFKTWTIDLDDLKQLLKCDEEATYREYKRFNDLILKRCRKEILEKTEQRFTYEPVKKGRNVVAIKFTLETPNCLLLEDDDFEEDLEELELQEDLDDPLTLLSDACNNEFSQEQMSVILEILRQKNIPEDEYGIDTARYRYLRQRYAQLNLRATITKIPNRYAYFVTMLKNDKL